MWALGFPERPLPMLLLDLLARCTRRQQVAAPCGGVTDGPGGVALPFLGGTDSGAVGHGEILPCGGRWICRPQQPGSVYHLTLTPRSIMEVPTIDRVGQATATPTFLLFSEITSDYTYTAGALK